MKSEEPSVGDRGEGLFRSVFEQSPQSIQVFAPDGRTLRVNRAWEELWGVTLEQIGDYNVLEDRQLVAKGVMPYIERGFSGEAAAIPAVLYEPDETTLNIERHGDPRRWVRAFIHPVKDAHGRISEVVLVHEDITDQRRAEESLRESEERFRLLFENSRDAIVIADEAGNYLQANDSACALLGYTREQLLGMNVSDLRTTNSPDAATLYQVYTRRGGETGEFSFVRPDGERRVAQYTACRFAPGLHLSILRDITERKRSEEGVRENEERLRLALDAGQVGTWDWDIARNRVTWSDRIYKFHGLRPGEFSGKAEDFVALVHPDDRERVAGAIAAALEGLPYSVEMRVVQPDGVARWIATSGRVLFGEDGKPARMLGATVDITERKLAEQALRESEDRYRDLVENSHELICTHDLEGRVLSVNPWAARILGFERSSILGMNIRDGLAPEHRDEFDQYLAKIKRDGFAQGVMQVRTARGERRVWEYHNTLRTEGVAAPVVRGMAHDVTERRQALAREREARREAEAANQSKDEFLATLSHELRTPLTAVVGWASMLRSERLDAETTAHALEVIERNAGAQAQIIEDILDVSRIITGTIRLNMQTTDPALAVVAAVETIRPAAQAKGVALACSLDPQAGTVTADPDRLRQIAWNLLSNAVKFTPQGGRVEIGLGRVGGHVRLVISDDGEGISPDFMPYIFERFRQADSSTTRRHGGLGLGLAIVRHLVELHGGTVSAASEGAGATFTVSLPVNQQHQQGADAPVGVSAGLAAGP
ncbi:MAG TPA: PAS domain S-box protein, partial [Pyrinomonadaceae bacterium]|nr:PAS domain S-box protein [Pyrinomonadaceae bacterium]